MSKLVNRRALLTAAPIATASLALGSGAAAATSDQARGHRWALFGSARDDYDPQNGVNECLSTLIGPQPGRVFAVAYRDFPPGTKIRELDNLIELDYFFLDRTCNAGSPRITLVIDADGDGEADANAHGYIGPPPSFTGCPMGVWLHELLAPGGPPSTVDPHNVPRWDLTQFGPPPFGAGLLPPQPFVQPWKTARDTITAAFPNHQVLAGMLVDDSGSFSPIAAGTAYYDNLTIGLGVVLADHTNTTRKG